MTTRKPFVNVNGQIQEIPDGDSLSGLSVGAISFSVVNGELIANSIADFSLTFSVVNGDLILN